MSTENTIYPIKPYSKGQLAQMYDVSVYTLRKWLKNVPGLTLTDDQIFTPAEIEKIFNHLGAPSK